jgi:predicted phosphodiesterase
MTARPTLTGRVGVIGDAHAEDALLETALAYFEQHGVSTVLAVGDVVDGYGSASRTCEILAERGVLTVRGNHDRWLVGGTQPDVLPLTDPGTLSHRAWAFLRDLPATLELETPVGLLLLCHGLGPNDMAKVVPTDEGVALESNGELQSLIVAGHHAVIVNGHTHRPMVRLFGSLSVVNAGTLKRDDDPCVVIIDFDRSSVEFTRFGEDGSLDSSRARELPLVP